tara:strand:- start:839 stop:1018 length:180 start_codon:yes stop_codon:yes gene_type:complete
MILKHTLTKDEITSELNWQYGNLMITQARIDHQEEHGDRNLKEQRENKRLILAQIKELK